MSTGELIVVRGEVARRFEAVVVVSDAVVSELRAGVEAALAAGVLVGALVDEDAAEVAAALGAHAGLVVVSRRAAPIGPPSSPKRDDVGLLGEASALAIRVLRERNVLVRVRHGDGAVVLEVEPAEHEESEPGGWVTWSDARVKGVRDLVASALADAALDVRVWADAGQVELSVHDLGDALRELLDEMWARGVSTGNVLVLADGTPTGRRAWEHGVLVDVGAATSAHVAGINGERAAAEAINAVLHDQAARRARRELPMVVPDTGWRIAVDGRPTERAAVDDALLVVADGEIGVGGAPAVAVTTSTPFVVVGGVYDGDGPATHLLEAPHPACVDAKLDPASLQRVLDLHAGVVEERGITEGGAARVVRFASMARPGTVVERLEVDARLDPATPLSTPAGHAEVAGEGVVSALVPATPVGGIAVASTGGRATTDAPYERFTAYVGSSDTVPDSADAIDHVIAVREAGFDRLLDEHRARWAQRWADADVVIEGDDELQTAVRFALFHLMASVRDHDEAAVGARGLTGPGYRGHVFWDGDTFVLPFLAATHPASARAMLEYRVRRLPVALANARAMGRRGARFPWESARTGVDVTPVSARNRTGALVPIRTGQLEDHIVADVAWASAFYEDWTGDEEYRGTEGLRLAVETARYWASRARIEPDGSAHIYGVIGPDEYHEPVDDNAYTNVMARWNLRHAAAAVEERGADDVGADEVARWRSIAASLVDGYDPDTGLYEQCARFYAMEPLLIADVAPRRPIAADYLLGIPRVRNAQVIKQPDVLMLHHLVPDEVARGTLEPNLRFYEPRTAHGSSLSPAIYASLFARARDHARALDALKLAARIDLDDLTGTSASGLHLATMGGVWQALAMGFAGLRARGGRLHLDARLPRQWFALALHVRFHGSRVAVRRQRHDLLVTADPSVEVVIDDRAYVVGPRGLRFTRLYDTWQVAP